MRSSYTICFFYLFILLLHISVKMLSPGSAHDKREYALRSCLPRSYGFYHIWFLWFFIIFSCLCISLASCAWYSLLALNRVSAYKVYMVGSCTLVVDNRSPLLILSNTVDSFVSFSSCEMQVLIVWVYWFPISFEENLTWQWFFSGLLIHDSLSFRCSFFLFCI